ncbi:hypothetical protein CYMTET_20079 [Cymbomonas tetramitiformis]|uniref:Uncharacterized protein n=1 Tax=Cymbomonas tetramitiformis TaxID=36881 RepID=A0AAE0G4R5_9CHLO|nr:hypothetical protein CYMTET_20079 [Cymbomonas tetramitiformis]
MPTILASYASDVAAEPPLQVVPRHGGATRVRSHSVPPCGLRRYRWHCGNGGCSFAPSWVSHVQLEQSDAEEFYPDPPFGLRPQFSLAVCIYSGVDQLSPGIRRQVLQLFLAASGDGATAAAPGGQVVVTGVRLHIVDYNIFRRF